MIETGIMPETITFQGENGMKRSLVVGMLLVAVLMNSAWAVGALFARRPLSNDSMKTLWLTNYNADVTITDQIAVTHVDQTFKNESNQQLEGIFVFPLPANAIVTELALWINGVRTVASVKDRDTARQICSSTPFTTVPIRLQAMLYGPACRY